MNVTHFRTKAQFRASVAIATRRRRTAREAAYLEIREAVLAEVRAA